MKRGHILSISVASAALMLAACATTDNDDAGEGGAFASNKSGVQSIPSPLEPEVAVTPPEQPARAAPDSLESVPPPPPPPAPPPPPSPLIDAPVGKLSELSSATATRSKTSSDVASSSRVLDRDSIRPERPIAPDEPRPQPEPQSGLLTAGDYDDVLNPELFRAYLDKALATEALLQKQLPYVDAADRISIKITDRLGKPMPFADISVATPQGETMFPLRTGADGMAYVYPNFDTLERGTRVSVSAAGAKMKSRAISGKLLKNGGELAFVMNRDAPKVQKLDVLLTLDATGSMSDEMRYLQTELTSIMSRMEADNPGLDIRAGLVVYRDKGDEYVIRDFDFTDDLAEFNASLGRQRARGGGDFPEAMDTALTKGLGLSWRDDAIKVNLLVADAPPHDEKINATWNTALHARVRGIHTVPLAASGVDPTAEFLMRSMAQLTGGRYLFLTDDSGVGNPHAEPTVDCYIVTPVNALVQRVLESLVSGVRVEPDGETVIRTVGNYQAGVCKLDTQDTQGE